MPTDRPTDAQVLLARGHTSLEQADYREAVECFSRAIALRPDVAGYRARARAYRELGQRTDALNDLDRAIRLKADDLPLYLERADLLFRQHSYDAALADCDRLVTADPNWAAVRALRGDCHAAGGDTDKALSDYTAAITAAGDDPVAAADVHRRRAALYLDGDNAAAAARDCDAALRLDPSNAKAYRVRGMAHREAGDFAAADADLTRALELDADTPLTLLARATVRFDLGDPAAAAADCDKALTLDPDNARAYSLRGMARRKGADLAGALADFTAAVKLAPDQPGPRNLRAGIHYHLGQYGRAVQDHLDALKCDPRSPSTFNQLGWLWATAPDPDVRNGRQAKECATRACELTEFQEAGYLDTLAAASAECGEFDEAQKWQAKALALAPPEQHADYEGRLALYAARKAYRAAAGG